MATAYIALGSNLGDRQAALDQALQLLERAGVHVARVSAIHETAPVGGPAGQGPYLNAAAQVLTDRQPADLLALLLDIENQLGRVRREHHGPRTLDLDLLLYEDRILREPNLVVPHPRLHERLFVLNPIAEIAPAVVHPILSKTVYQLRIEALSKEVPGRELSGLRVLVTGSTSGIGRAIARELGTAGADVIVHGRRMEAAAAVEQELQGLGIRTATVLADLAEPGARSSLIEQAWALWKGVDVWVNNAGADTLTGDAARWSFEAKLQALWNVDVEATIDLSRAVGRHMQDQGGGVILNMGWDQAETGMEGDSGQLFAAAKGAVMAFSKSLAVSLAPLVRVNCLAPGWIRTSWGESASSSWQERVRRETPLARWGTPEDVAAAVRWLAAPRSSFVTGQIVRVNGGAVR